MPATEVVDLQHQAARLAEAVREAGVLALAMFKTPLKNWTKGEALSPVSDADIAVDVLLRERLTSSERGHRLAVGGKRRRSGAPRRAPCLDRRSDRRHARLYRRPAGLGGLRRAGRERPAGRGVPLCAGQRRILRCGRWPWRDPQRRCDRGHARRANRGSAHRRPAKISRPVANHRAAVCRHAAHALAGAALGPGRRGNISRRPLPAATAMTGTLRPPTFWCTKRAAH